MGRKGSRVSKFQIRVLARLGHQLEPQPTSGFKLKFNVCLNSLHSADNNNNNNRISRGRNKAFGKQIRSNHRKASNQSEMEDIIASAAYAYAMQNGVQWDNVVRLTNGLQLETLFEAGTDAGIKPRVEDCPSRASVERVLRAAAHLGEGGATGSATSGTAPAGGLTESLWTTFVMLAIGPCATKSTSEASNGRHEAPEVPDVPEERGTDSASVTVVSLLCSCCSFSCSCMPRNVETTMDDKDAEDSGDAADAVRSFVEASVQAMSDVSTTAQRLELAAVGTTRRLLADPLKLDALYLLLFLCNKNRSDATMTNDTRIGFSPAMHAQIMSAPRNSLWIVSLGTAHIQTLDAEAIEGDRDTDTVAGRLAAAVASTESKSEVERVAGGKRRRNSSSTSTSLRLKHALRLGPLMSEAQVASLLSFLTRRGVRFPSAAQLARSAPRSARRRLAHVGRSLVEIGGGAWSDYVPTLNGLARTAASLAHRGFCSSGLLRSTLPYAIMILAGLGVYFGLSYFAAYASQGILAMAAIIDRVLHHAAVALGTFVESVPFLKDISAYLGGFAVVLKPLQTVLNVFTGHFVPPTVAEVKAVQLEMESISPLFQSNQTKADAEFAHFLPLGDVTKVGVDWTAVLTDQKALYATATKWLAWTSASAGLALAVAANPGGIVAAAKSAAGLAGVSVSDPIGTLNNLATMSRVAAVVMKTVVWPLIKSSINVARWGASKFGAAITSVYKCLYESAFVKGIYALMCGADEAGKAVGRPSKALASAVSSLPPLTHEEQHQLAKGASEIVALVLTEITKETDKLDDAAVVTDRLVMEGAKLFLEAESRGMLDSIEIDIEAKAKSKLKTKTQTQTQKKQQGRKPSRERDRGRDQTTLQAKETSVVVSARSGSRSGSRTQPQPQLQSKDVTVVPATTNVARHSAPRARRPSRTGAATAIAAAVVAGASAPKRTTKALPTKASPRSRKRAQH